MYVVGSRYFYANNKLANFSLIENMTYVSDTVFGVVIIGKTPVAKRVNEISTNCTIQTPVCLHIHSLYRLM